MKYIYLIFLFGTCIWARAVEEMDNFNSEIDKELLGQELLEIAGDDDSEDVAMSEIGHWYGSTKIAFSVYLSGSRSFGSGQHIKFDRILLNDGDAYEAVTGVFRTKVSGVYVFTYVIGQTYTREVRANLVYNGKIINGAVAEGVRSYHDVQGTNTAVIHVKANEPVWVEIISAASLVGHTGRYRFTTFSGYLLYARN